MDDESNEVDVFRLRQHQELKDVGNKTSSPDPSQSKIINPVPQASGPSTAGLGLGGQDNQDEPLPEDEGKEDDVIDEEIDQRRVAMRDAFRKLLGQKLGSIYVTNHQERKPKPKLPYYVRVNHNVIDYREVVQGRKKRYTYNFNTGECKLDTQVIGRYHIKRFFKKLDQVSEDITNKVSLVYEEPKKPGA